MLRKNHWLVCTSVVLVLSVPWAPASNAQDAPLASTAEEAATTLIQVSFGKADYIYTGELANYRSAFERIRFGVQARDVRRTETDEHLWSGEAIIIFRQRVIRRDDAARSAQYCLDIVRSLTVTPNPNLEMTMFLNALSFEGPAIVVQTVHSCALQAPPAS